MDENGISAKETVAASKKLGRKEAAGLVRSASRVFVAKGKKVAEYPGGKASAAVVDALLGPTGNLRAPCLRASKNLLVGFNEEVYSRVLL